MIAKYDSKLNVTGFSCPLPVLKAQLALQSLKSGEVLWVVASDPQTFKDLPALVAERSDIMQLMYEKTDEYHFFIQKA